MKKEGEQGSIAKRWSRRTGRNVEGRIEFRREAGTIGRPGNGTNEAIGRLKAAAATGKLDGVEGPKSSNSERLSGKSVGSAGASS